MNLIFKIAWRNIFRHKGKSLVIGAILFLGALLMTAGNGVITGMNKGLQKHIVEDFSGDIVIASAKQEGDNVFLDPMGKTSEPITNFPDIEVVLKSQSYVYNYLPVGKNMVMVLNDEGSPDGGFVLGVDFEKYQAMFPGNLAFVNGAFPSNGKGVLMPTGGRKTLFMSMGLWFTCKGCPLDTVDMPIEGKNNLAAISTRSDIVFMGMNEANTSTDIRQDISGVVKYKAMNQIFGHFMLMDIEAYRQCMGYITAQEKTIAIPEEQKALLNMDANNIDALFSDNSLMTTNKKLEKAASKVTPVTAAKDQSPVNLESGAYNLVLVRLKKGENLNARTAELNTALTKANTTAKAIVWSKAIGPVGSMAVLIKAALFVFVMFLFFVAIIIIVNTLSMAALERTSEIGMMRAVGARKGFISYMFFAETALLSFFFGGIGIVCGAILVKLIALARIAAANDMIQLLYGGDRFNPFLTPTDIMLCLVQLALVTLIAVVYPLGIARKITPLDAVSRE
jgi:putative ABC transport system permease protein